MGLKKEKIHITGGRGFIGRKLRKKLTPRCQVTFSDLPETDISRPESIRERLAQDRPQTVIHLAGLTNASKSLQEPRLYFEINTMGTFNVLEACRLLQIPNFIFFSSLSVYGQSNALKKEDDPLRPRHPYAASKAAAEMMVQMYGAAYGLRAIILRPTIVIGPGQTLPDMLYEFVQAVKSGQPLVLLGQGRHRRQWLFIEDLISGVQAALRRLARQAAGSVETFILAPKRSLTVRQAAELVIKRAQKGRLQIRPATRQAFSLAGSPKKAGRELGWRAHYSMERIIDTLLKF